jgi:hypothetical protein
MRPKNYKLREPPSLLELRILAARVELKSMTKMHRSRGRRAHPRPALRTLKPKHAGVAAYYTARATAKKAALKVRPVKP